MKHLKLFALTALAASAVAMAVAGSASATVLCTVTTTSCPGSFRVTTTVDNVIKADLVTGTTTEFKEPLGAFETCTGSTMEATVTKTGSVTETVGVSLPAKSLAFTGCVEGPVASLAAVELEIHWISGSLNGTVTAKGLEMTVTYRTMGSCVYALGTETDIGKLTGSATATSEARLQIDAHLTKKSGFFFCPSSMQWLAEYRVTQPKPLYVLAS